MRAKGLARDMRVRWALEEVGQPYDVRLLSMTALKEPEHRARNPFGSIPTYEEGDLTLFESGAIVFHIAERHEGLFPKDADARARAITWMFAALNTVEPPIVDHAEAWLFEKDKSWRDEHCDDRQAGPHPARRPVEAPWRRRLDRRRVQRCRHLDGASPALARRSGIVEEFPNLAAYVARGEARPAYQRAFEAQAAVFRAATEQ